MITFDDGLIITCRFPRFSALYMLLSASFKTPNTYTTCIILNSKLACVNIAILECIALKLIRHLPHEVITCKLYLSKSNLKALKNSNSTIKFKINLQKHLLTSYHRSHCNIAGLHCLLPCRDSTQIISLPLSLGVSSFGSVI